MDLKTYRKRTSLLDLNHIDSVLRSKYILFGCLLLLWMGCIKPSTEKTAYQNVLVIVGDDHAISAMGAYGNNIIKTPNLDALAHSGALFKNAYSSSPLCSASRQSLLTGKYPHATGVNLLFTPFDDHSNETLAEHLQAFRFRTALIGKQHFNTWIWRDLYQNGLPKFGFDTLIDQEAYRNYLDSNPVPELPKDVATFSRDRSDIPLNVARMNPNARPHPYPDSHAKGTFLARSAIDFIQSNKDHRWMAWLAFNEPHAPFAFPVEYANFYDPDEMVIPESGPEDDRWIPERFRGFTDEEIRGIIAAYYSSVTFMDKNVGMVMEALERSGELEETLIVYLGDQGYLLYDHKRFEKHTMWSQAIKAPLIIKGKNIPAARFDDLVEFVDLAPTICEALGLDPMTAAQGHSFYPLVSKSKGSSGQKKYVFAEYLEDNKAMIANKRWKYIFSTGKRDLGQGYATGYGPSGIIHRLYDLKQDPMELKNVASQYPDTLHTLKEAMLQKFHETHPGASKVPPELSLDGKLVWFCEPRDIGAEYGGQPLRTFYE